MRYIVVSLLFAAYLAANDSIVCEVLGEESKRVQCTFFSTRAGHDRNITFHWISPSLRGDDRKRTIILKAHHGSIYDFRYYYGRSPGEWVVTISEDNATLAKTTFIIDEEDEDY